MERLEDVRRPILIAGAALLVVLGLVLALSAPGGAAESNKVQGYGGPVAEKPTKPKTRAACDAYYGKGEGRKLPDARECLAKVRRYAGNRKCAKKSGAEKTACKKAVKRKYKKALRKIKKQREAEKACSTAYTRDSSALDPNDPQYNSKQEALGKKLQDCLARAR